MKIIINYLLIFILFAGVLYSCKSEKEPKYNYLPDLKVEIPASLKDNPEAIEFINGSSQALNEWSKNLEDLVIECQPYVGKEESELSAMDKLKLGKLMMEFMSDMGRFAVKAAEMDQHFTQIEDGLTEGQQQAFVTVMNAFKTRIEEINTRYQNFGKDEEETE